MGKRPWLWRAGPKPGRGLGVGRGLCLGPTGLEKAVGLTLKGQKRPRRAPHPWSQRAGDQLGSSAGSLCPSGRGSHPPLLSCSSRRAPPACISWSPWPQGLSSCLASTSPLPSVPPHPTGSLGGSSHLLGHQGPPPAASRFPSCGEMLTRCLSTPPSSTVMF